jgi:hypothetical protein
MTRQEEMIKDCETLLFAVTEGLKECRTNTKVKFLGDQSAIILKHIFVGLQKITDSHDEIPAEVKAMWERLS